MPPVLTAKGVIVRLADGIVPPCVSRIEVGVFGPRYVNFWVVVVLYAVRVDCVPSIDFGRGQGVLDVSPRQIMVSTVSG